MSEHPPVVSLVDSSSGSKSYETYSGINVNYDRVHDGDEVYISSIAPLIVKQLQDVGFVVVDVNKEDAKIVENANKVSKAYFEENSNAQKWCDSLKPEGLGYSHFGGKCTRQAFTVNLPAPGEPFPWPSHPDDFQKHITDYFQLQQKLGTDLLSLISMGMNQEKNSLIKYLECGDSDGSKQFSRGYSDSILFIRHYQSEKVGENLDARTVWPKDHTREHTDSGILTLKPLSEIAALQIMRWSDRKWVDAEVQSDLDNFHIIVLAGEELGFLTNGVFKAAIHRVSFQDTNTRISLPFQLRGNRNIYPNMDYHSSSLKMIAISLQ